MISAPDDIYLFPWLEKKLKGHRFVETDVLIQNETNQLKDFCKNGFQKCFEQLNKRWDQCVDVDAGGKYFEGQSD
ncbi:uncharacterized protein TNCV_4552941 [Trichonephila clavipes]|nr:uncharacterized protein TNCV_4552941 [Trichonephila clavipes]